MGADDWGILTVYVSASALLINNYSWLYYNITSLMMYVLQARSSLFPLL